MGEMAYAYYSGGAEDERLVADNVAAWRRWRLHPRVLRDVATIDTTTTVLGDVVASPVLIAPTAIQRLASPDGERATARAACRAGTVLCLSSLSTTPLDEVATAGAGAPQWMQIYILKDRGRTLDMVEQVKAAGYKALALTVDAPVSGLRTSELRGGVALPSDLTLPNLADHSNTHAKDAGFMAVVSREFDPSITFDDVAWLAEHAGLPVLAKGVARADDALACIDSGAAGVIVSNHGGRQLDDAPPTAEVLPEVADALGGAYEVYVDGGIRRPADVVKAISLGARAVLLGRPILWALGAGGEDGVVELLEWFGGELRRAMALVGAARIEDIDASLAKFAL
jgi:isopentenyl diphosphate isomerase/L-lactate dehydrogenase-like FMN-dependent dehydrogenase